jgi:hypothetical protein
MTPQQFIAQWGPGGAGYALNERQGAQAHFMDLCALLGVPTPGSTGDYLFEQDTLVLAWWGRLSNWPQIPLGPAT